MIISRTPLRMSFVGGGSDLPSFYRQFGGAVLSTSINKYIYVTVNKKFDDWIRLSYSITEEVPTVSDVQHKIAKAILEKLKINGGIEITTIADIPAKGTGLGSSSSFTIGLLHALYAYQHQYVSAEDLGRESCEVEIDICKEPIGKQDQYSAAFGGLNLIEFHPNDTVNVSPVICAPQTVSTLENNIIVFYTGLTRSASGILKKQSEDFVSEIKIQNVMKRMVDLAYVLKNELHKNNIDAFGEILHENWLLKKEVNSGVSTPIIDEWYNKAIAAGATGGKILGAGAGGFLMLYAHQDKHEAIARALSDLRRVNFKFERHGSKIIFYH